MSELIIRMAVCWPAVGIELLSLKPRTESIVNTDKYKVDERITTLSYEAHVKYTNKDWFIAAKSVLGSNLTQASGLGGFGIKSVNEQTGEQEYTRYVSPALGSTLSTDRNGSRNLRRLCQESGNK